MTRSIGPALGLGLALMLAAGGASQTSPEAIAVLWDLKGQQVGKAHFVDQGTGVVMTLEVAGLPPGRHGMHIHTTGACHAPDFASAGGHFNPTGKQHGLHNAKGHHVGDMPNLEVGSDGKATVTTTITGTTLGQGENSLLKPGGTSLVIHADPDDETSDPAGNSGKRIACGVIQAPAKQ